MIFMVKSTLFYHKSAGEWAFLNLESGRERASKCTLSNLHSESSSALEHSFVSGNQWHELCPANIYYNKSIGRVERMISRTQECFNA